MDSPTQFLILCAPRTGSTMLRRLLNEHPQICCHGEVLEPNQIRGFVGLEKDTRSGPIGEWMHAVRARSPLEFVRDWVFYPGSKKAVGFKTVYKDFDAPENADLRRWLLENPRLKVVHLRRENLVKRYLSEVVAVQKTGVFWIKADAERPEQCKVDLDLAALKADLAEQEARYAAVREGLKNNEVFETTYEALTKEDDSERRRVQEFLGVAPAELAFATRKINSDDLREVVTNHSEVAAGLQGTSWAWMTG